MIISLDISRAKCE